MRRTLRSPILALVVAMALVAAGCGSAAVKPPARDVAQIAVAGSLEGLVQQSLQPAFSEKTHDSFVGRFEGSRALARSILHGRLASGAFFSLGQGAIRMLWPRRSHFDMTIATDPLVIAFSEKSAYHKELNQIRKGERPLRDLFSLLATPGFRLGRTDPYTDPQGCYFILMIELAQRELGLPKDTAEKILGTTATDDIGSSSQLYDQSALPIDIQTGSLDAGSDYLTEARQYQLEYITLPSEITFADPRYASLYASVSLRLRHRHPFRGGLISLDDTLVLPQSGKSLPLGDEVADERWLAFLLSPEGRSLVGDAGYVLQTPALYLAKSYKTARSVLPRRLFRQYERLVRGARRPTTTG